MSRLDDVADSSETLAHFLKCCLFSVMKSAAHRSLRWTQICLMVVLAGSHTHSVSIYPEKFTNFHRLSHLARCRQSQCVWLDKKLEVIFDCELTGKLPPLGPVWIWGWDKPSHIFIQKMFMFSTFWLDPVLQDYPEFPSSRPRLL